MIEHHHDRRRREAAAAALPTYRVLEASHADGAAPRGPAATPPIDATAIYARRAATVAAAEPTAVASVAGAYATGRPLPDPDQVYERRRQAVARAAAG